MKNVEKNVETKEETSLKIIVACAIGMLIILFISILFYPN